MAYPERINTAIVGGGPGGLAAAQSLGALLPRSEKVTLFEGGRKVRNPCPVLDKQTKCPGCGGQCNVIEGGGGACSAVSCGLLSKWPAGSGLEKYASIPEIQSLERQIISWLEQIHGSPLTLVEPHIEPAIIGRLAQEGIKNKAYASYEVLGQEFEDLIQQTIEGIGRNPNVDMRFQTTVTSVVPNKHGGFDVVANNKREGMTNFHADNVIFAAGRTGKKHGVFEMWRQLGVEVGGIYGYTGIRIEGPVRPELQRLREQVADPKFIDDKAMRIFCFCPEGKVVGMRMHKHELSDHSPLEILEGCVEPGTGFGNFSIQQAQEFPSFDEYKRYMETLVARYRAIGNLRLFAQSLTSLVNNTTPTAFPSSIQKRQTENVGSIRDLFDATDPYLVGDALEFLFKLNKVFSNGIITPTTGVWAPELHYWPEVILGPGLESTTASGIHVIGDISGVARGIMQAMIGAKLAAAHIASK